MGILCYLDIFWKQKDTPYEKIAEGFPRCQLLNLHGYAIIKKIYPILVILYLLFPKKMSLI